MAYAKVNWTENETSPGSGIPETPLSAANLRQMETNLEEALAGTGGAPKIQEAALDTGVVTNSKILAGAVTESKLGAGSVVEAKLGAGAVTATKIGALAVTEEKINTGAVTVNKIGALAVTEAKIADLAVTEWKIGAGAVASAKLKSDLRALLQSKYASGTIAATDTWPQTVTVTFPSGVLPIIDFAFRGLNSDPTPDVYSAWHHEHIPFYTGGGGNVFIYDTRVLVSYTYSGTDLTVSFLPVCVEHAAASGSASYNVIEFSGADKAYFYLRETGGSITNDWDAIEIQYAISAIGQL